MCAVKQTRQTCYGACRAHLRTRPAAQRITAAARAPAFVHASKAHARRYPRPRVVSRNASGPAWRGSGGCRWSHGDPCRRDDETISASGQTSSLCDTEHSGCSRWGGLGGGRGPLGARSTIGRQLLVASRTRCYSLGVIHSLRCSEVCGGNDETKPGIRRNALRGRITHACLAQQPASNLVIQSVSKTTHSRAEGSRDAPASRPCHGGQGRQSAGRWRR